MTMQRDPNNKLDKVLFSNKFGDVPSRKRKKNVGEQQNDQEGSGRFALMLLMAAGVLILFISLVGDYGWLSLNRAQSGEAELKAEIADLKSRERGLLQTIDALKTNSAYIESLARRDLGMVRPNEIVYLLPQARDAE